VLPDAFLRSTQECQFPVVDRPCAIGSKMCNPATFNQRNDNRHRPILNQMRAIHEGDTRIPLASGDDLFSTIGNCFADLRTAVLRRLSWIHQELINAAQAVALRERIHLYLCEIDWFREVSQWEGVEGLRFSDNDHLPKRDSTSALASR